MSSTEKNITFDQMPELISQLAEKVEHLTELVKTKFAAQSSVTPTDESMDIDQLCEYLPDHPAKSTVYGWIGQRLIPYHKSTKKLSFKKNEIDAWLALSRRATADELKSKAINTHGTKKGGSL